MQEADGPVMALAAEVAASVAASDLMARTARYTVPGRLSGSPALETMLGRVAEDLRSLGLGVHEGRVRALTSRPGRALVRLGGTIYPGQSAAFAAPAVDRRGPACRFAGSEAAEWPGRVLVLSGLPTADAVALAQASEARALVCLVPDAGPHLVGVSPVWGSPTPWTVGNLPSMPVAVLAGEVAASLAARLEPWDPTSPPPPLSVTAGVDTRWRDIPYLTADLAGPDDAFVLAGAHADAWFDGAMDNAAGVAALVEAAAALAAPGVPLRRGLRLGIWSGHEDAGRAGAQSYADSHWQGLEQSAALYVQVAAPGGRGNADLGGLGALPEAAFLVRDAVAAVARAVWQGPGGVGPAGDRSFAGIGLGSAHVGGGRPPDDPAWPHGRAWHSPDDRLDHLDPTLLARDAAVAAHVLAHAALRPLEPVDLAEGARALEAAVTLWAERLRGHLDLRGAARRAASLVERSETLERASAAVAAPGPELNVALRRAGRLVVRLGATATSRFDHDAALPLGPLPTLSVCESLLGTPPGSAPADLAGVAAQRARTAVEVSLDEAGERVAAALALTDSRRRR